jgi:hypothetical protein
MHVLKPPARCPACGELPSNLAKQWDWMVVKGRLLRYPLALLATYRCGASIEATYVVRNSLTGSLGGASWRLDVRRGCSQQLGDILVHLMPPRSR